MTSASTLKVEELQPEIDELLRHFARMMKDEDEPEEEWLAYVFVSDESRIGDFIYMDTDMAELRVRLGIPDVEPRDLIWSVAAFMHSMKRPQ